MEYKGWIIEETYYHGWYIAYPPDCDDYGIIDNDIERLKQDT